MFSAFLLNSCKLMHRVCSFMFEPECSVFELMEKYVNAGICISYAIFPVTIFSCNKRNF